MLQTVASDAAARSNDSHAKARAGTALGRVDERFANYRGCIAQRSGAGSSAGLCIASLRRATSLVEGDLDRGRSVVNDSFARTSCYNASVGSTKPMPLVRPSHLIQLYEQEEEFSFPVARYLFEGMQRGESLLAIATAEHRAAISRDLRQMVDGMRIEQEPVMLDTNEMLPRVVTEGYPDAERFDRSVGEAVRVALARSGGRGLRVFGDMVAVLWEAGRFPSAIRLEQLWGRLLDSRSFSLLCAYPVDLFGKLFDMDILDALFCAHSHFVPSKDGERLEAALDRAMEGVLDTRLETFRRSVSESRFGRWPPLPPAEAAILWLRKTLPHKADDVLARARQLYQESA